MKKLITILSFTLTSLFFLSSGWAQKMTPGLWEATSQFRVNGIPLPTSVDEECITKEMTQNLREKLLEELKGKGCKLDKWNLKKQNLEAELSCDKDDLKAKGQIKGQVTSKSYDLTGDAEGSYKGIPSVANIKLTGKWKAKCQK